MAAPLVLEPETASTRNVWSSCESPLYVTPLAHAVKDQESREHLNVTCAWESVNVKVADDEVVGFDGEPAITGRGTLEAARDLTTNTPDAKTPAATATSTPTMRARPAGAMAENLIMPTPPRTCSPWLARLGGLTHALTTAFNGPPGGLVGRAVETRASRPGQP